MAAAPLGAGREKLDPGVGEPCRPYPNTVHGRAELSPNIYENLQKIGLKAHEVLGCRGVTEIAFRFDGRANGASGLVCLGVNTQPSLGALSPVPEQARVAGHSFADLVAWMVEDASCSR